MKRVGILVWVVALAMGCDAEAPHDAGGAPGLDAPGLDAPGLDAPPSDAPRLDGGSGPLRPDLPALSMLPSDLGPRYPDGVAPGDPALCEATPPSRCWWVDADAPPGGDGSFERPYASFETVVGVLEGDSYRQGLLGGGDHLYVRGTFHPAVDDAARSLRIVMRRASQGGTREAPTVIASWRGSPRAVFDGAGAPGPLLLFANMTDFRVTNVEIRNADGRGLVVESMVGRATFEDLVVHDTLGDGTVGIAGGLSFWGGADQEYVVQHCHFYENDRDAFGAINNIGALSLTSDLLAPDSGSLRVYRNIFSGETTGVRHKHAGAFDTEIAENLFMDGERGIVLRSFRSNDVHDNVFLNLSQAAIVSYVENTRGDLTAEVHHNDFFGVAEILSDVVGLHDHAHRIDLHHNFVHGTTSNTMFELSEESVSWLSTGSNLYVLPSADRFFVSTAGGDDDFTGFGARLGDTTSAHHLTSETRTSVEVHQAAYEAYAAERAAAGIGL